MYIIKSIENRDKELCQFLAKLYSNERSKNKQYKQTKINNFYYIYKGLDVDVDVVVVDVDVVVVVVVV